MRWLTLLAPLVVVACVQQRPPVKPPTPPPDEGERISAEEAAWVDETGAVRMPENRRATLRRVVLRAYGDGHAGEREILMLYGPVKDAPEWVRWYRVGWQTWFVWNNAGPVREILVEHKAH